MPEVLPIWETLPRHSVPVRLPSQIVRILIHCTDGPREQTPAAVARFHTAAKPAGRGWPSIAYHFFVDGQGRIYKTLKNTDIGFHCKGENTESLGVVWTGRDADTPTDAQWTALVWLVAKVLLTAYPRAQVYGHRERPSGASQGKTCPGTHFDMDAFRTAVALRRQQP